MTATTAMTAAKALYMTDWDENPVTTVTMPADVADTLLEARGWTRVEHTSGYAGWVAPGESFDGRSWRNVLDRDVALRLALTAEVI